MHIPVSHKSCHTKAVWVQYKLSCDEAGLQAAAYTNFTSFWWQLAPQIMVLKPMNDLCCVCQKNSVAIMRAANRPDTAKSEVNYTSHEHAQNRLQQVTYQ